MSGIRGNEGVFKAADGVPILGKDLAIVAATRHSRGSAILLRPIDTVWKRVIGRDVVELPGRLVVPGAPCPAAIHTDDGSLVNAQNHARRTSRIDPEHVEVVATGRTYVRFKRLSSVGRAIERSLGHVDDIGIIRVHEDSAEVAAADDTGILGRLMPGSSAIVRSEKSLVENCIQAPAISSGGDCNSHSLARLLRQTLAFERRPG